MNSFTIGGIALTIVAGVVGAILFDRYLKQLRGTAIADQARDNHIAEIETTINGLDTGWETSSRQQLTDPEWLENAQKVATGDLAKRLEAAHARASYLEVRSALIQANELRLAGLELGYPLAARLEAHLKMLDLWGSCQFAAPPEAIDDLGPFKQLVDDTGRLLSDYVDQLVEQAKAEPEPAYKTLRSLLVRDRKRLSDITGLSIPCPWSWLELVAHNIEQPTLVDFGLYPNRRAVYDEYDLARFVVQAIWDNDVTAAKIVLAHDNTEYYIYLKSLFGGPVGIALLYRVAEGKEILPGMEMLTMILLLNDK